MTYNTPTPWEPDPAAAPPPFGQPGYGATPPPPPQPSLFAEQAPSGAPPVPGPPGPGLPGPGPYGPGGPGYPLGPRPTESLAIVGLVLAICGVAVAAIPVSIVALRRIKRNFTGGRGLTIAAFVISGFWLAFQLLFLGLVIWAAAVDLSSDSGSPTRPVSTPALTFGTADGGSDSKSVKDLKVGECLEDLGSSSVRRVTVVGCTQPHKAEVLGEFAMPGTSYPVEDTIAEEAGTQCARFLPKDFQAGSSDLEMVYLYPLEADWLLGDHMISCLVISNGTPMTAPVG